MPEITFDTRENLRHASEQVFLALRLRLSNTTKPRTASVRPRLKQCHKCKAPFAKRKQQLVTRCGVRDTRCAGTEAILKQDEAKTKEHYKTLGRFSASPPEAMPQMQSTFTKRKQQLVTRCGVRDTRCAGTEAILKQDEAKAKQHYKTQGRFSASPPEAMPQMQSTFTKR